MSLASVPSPIAASCSTTQPVSVREPTGTRTRAPTGGSTIVSGTRYVRRSRNGTGTATEIRRNALAIRRSASFTCQDRSHFLHVVPDIALRGRRSQQVRGMVGRNQDRVAVLEFAPAQPR